MSRDTRFMDAAIGLSMRGLGRTSPNPNVGCIIEKDGIVLGRGWTHSGGRPHAEAAALEQAGSTARGAALHSTLEPCAHVSKRGPACADIIAAAGLAKVMIGTLDPDPRTSGKGAERLRAAGIVVETGIREAEARRAMAGFFCRLEFDRPRITLKLAMSIDGRVAMPDGESQWITGPEARAHGHMQRAFADVVLVGRGTVEADDPSLDVRIAGLEDRTPRPAILSATLNGVPSGSKLAARDPLLLTSTEALYGLDVNDVLVEGGSGTASTLLRSDLVDRLLIYRAPILLGDGAPGTGRLGLEALADAHGRWTLADTRTLGCDRLEIYERVR